MRQNGSWTTLPSLLIGLSFANQRLLSNKRLLLKRRLLPNKRLFPSQDVATSPLASGGGGGQIKSFPGKILGEARFSPINSSSRNKRLLPNRQLIPDRRLLPNKQLLPNKRLLPNNRLFPWQDVATSPLAGGGGGGQIQSFPGKSLGEAGTTFQRRSQQVASLSVNSFLESHPLGFFKFYIGRRQNLPRFTLFCALVGCLK